MLLVHPPACRSTEAPLGLARLAGFLRTNGLSVECLDLNQEGLDYLLCLEAPAVDAADTWSRRALKGRAGKAADLRCPAAYASPGRYGRAVADLSRALAVTSRSLAPGVEVGLADYHDEGLSPLRKTDLVAAADRPGASPFRAFFEDRLSSLGPQDLVGISVNFLSQALPAFALAGIVRTRWPAAKIVMGGGLVTSWILQGRITPEEGFSGHVDHLVAGRGEEALAALCGLPPPWRQAAPDFSDFKGLGYFAPTGIVPYNFSLGCPWKHCSFCPEKAENSRYQSVPTDRAHQEVAFLADRYGPGLFHLTDNEIAPLHLRALAAEAPGRPWYGFARFSPLLEDPGFCRDLAASGCRMLQLGLESGDQSVLDSLCKGTELAGIDRALRALDEAGIAVFLYVLFGTPAEDHDAALRTRDFVASRAGLVDFINVAIFNMPVTSPEAAGLSARPFYEGDLSLYCEFSHPRGWNRGEVRRFLSSEFEAEPAIKAIIRRTPPVFTSNHAVFFLP
jgi:hypothetical protein